MTGSAPTYRTALTLATKVRAGTITSSPGPTPAASSARCSAAVPLLTAATWRTPRYSLNASSNSAVRGPMVSQPELRQSSTASTSVSVGSTAVRGTVQVISPARPRSR